MADFLSLKTKLISHCTQFIEDQLAHVHEAISLAKNAAKEESKSSAGDKHETGKSHLQLTQENNSKHLANLQQQKRVIKLLESCQASETVKLGSIVSTNKGVYYLAIGIGQVRVNQTLVYVVSPASPVGKAMMNRKIGEVVKFNALNIEIKEIA